MMLEIDDDEREIIKATLSQIGCEIKAKNPKANFDEIKEWLKSLLDVSV